MTKEALVNNPRRILAIIVLSQFCCTSLDGKIIEAIEHQSYPNVFGVQFHPEKPGLFDPSIDHPRSCDSRINFNEMITKTGSYKFHMAYWRLIGKILQKNW